LFGKPKSMPRALASETPSTREVILDVAEREFAERGYAGVSMRKIAAGAGLKNQASLYHHFRDKRALYEAVLERGLTPIFTLVAESGRMWRDGRPEAMMEAFLDRTVEHLALHPHLPRLIQRAGLDDGSYFRSVLDRYLRPIYLEGLRVLGAAGPWAPDQLPHLAIGLYHLIFGYFADTALLEMVLGENPRSPAAVTRQRRFLKAAVAQLLGVKPVRAPRARRI